MERRPLRIRSRPIAGALAGGLLRLGVRPNHVSLASVIFAVGAAGAFLTLPRLAPLFQAALLLAAALAIQLRLLANLLDGLLAVEGGLGSPAGELYNDVPDRLADPLILVAAGYSIPWSGGAAIGWAAAAAALLTAYVRVLGGALGARQHFSGPMAKQHRMAVLTAACVLSVAEVFTGGFEGRVLLAALAIVLAGSLVTFVRRLRLVAEELSAR